MSFSATARRLLISCPGDVPDKDLSIVRQAINHWNGVYGENFGSVVLPISWSEHAAAEFGQPPQSILNNQIVDNADGCIAIFANRLGTPTATAESGTAEEIQRLAESGKYVAVLRCMRDVNMGRVDLQQAARLEEYMTRIREQALVLSYSSDAELAQHLSNILVQAVSRDQARAEMQRADEPVPPVRNAEVWPRVDSSERVSSDARGGVRTTRDWRLVLHNTGQAPARNVYFHLDEGSNWRVIGDSENPDEPDVEILAPGSEARFILMITLGSSQRAQCTVTWEDDRGRQQNTATLRIA